MRYLLLLLVCVGCSQKTVRFATYNASLFREAQGELVEDLSTPDDVQAQAVAAVIQTVRPDVLLVNEFDWDADGKAADLFRENYLQVSQGGREPIVYPYVYVAESNTGIPSGHDLNNDGKVGGELGTRDYGNDALGYGTFPGQYSFILLSKYPIDHDGVRTFRVLKWAEAAEEGNEARGRLEQSEWAREERGNLGPLPEFVGPPPNFYTNRELAALPLSSKNHVHLPVTINGDTVHVLASHPTPPGFDGEEDRNGRRNHDEIALVAATLPMHLKRNPWAIFLAAYDRVPTAFVVMGDLNADPVDGGSVPGAMGQLLEHPRVQDPQPRSDGGTAAATRQGGANASHAGDPALDTADFSDGSVGNLRVDYVLPSVDLKVKDGGIYWPNDGAELELVERASDHRLVWVDAVVK